MSSISTEEKKAVLQEANLLQNLRHKHIVQHIESFLEDTEPIIIMEHCSGFFIRR